MKMMTWYYHLLANRWKPAVLSVWLGVGTIASSIGLLGTSAFVIASAALHPSIAELQVAIVGIRVFGILRGVFRYAERLVSHDANLQILAGLRTRVFNRLVALAPAGLESRSTGEAIESVVTDVDALETLYVRLMMPALTAVTITFGMGFFIGSYSWILGVILVSGLLTGSFLIPEMTRWMGRRPAAEVAAAQRDLRSTWMAWIGSQAEIKVYDTHNQATDLIGILSSRLVSAQLRLASSSAFGGALSLIVAHMTAFLVLVFCIMLVGEGRLSGVMLSVMVITAMASFESVNNLQAGASQRHNSLAAAGRLFQLEAAVLQVMKPVNPSIVPESVSIHFVQIFHRYPGQLSNALTDVTLNIPPESHVGLIGKSGCGKSTLFGLLLRHWVPFSGKISLGSTQLSEIGLDDWHRMIAWAPQNPVIFSASLKANLRLAVPQASDAVLWEALDAVGLAYWARSLPNQLDTWMGEFGSHVSAGERQRIGLARVFVQDASIYLLDEPTANLDVDTEQLVLSAIHQKTNGKTLLLASHRMACMELMDEVVVLEDGRIIEHGMPPSLMLQAGSLYRAWRELESGYFLDE